MNPSTRREFIKAFAAVSSASVLSFPLIARAGAKARVVVIGGGYGGATAAKYVKLLDGGIDVTLIEPNKIYTSCPLSNEVIVGHREIATLQIGYDGLKKRGVNVLHDYVTGVNREKKVVTTQGGRNLAGGICLTTPWSCHRASSSSSTPSRATTNRWSTTSRTPGRRATRPCC